MKTFKIENGFLNAITIDVNDSGIIESCSSTPNGRPHWLVGNSLEWVKSFYGYTDGKNRTSIDHHVQYHLTQI